MAEIEHRDLTGAQLHEPKGVATAPNNTVYVADGSGSGVWSDILATVKNRNIVPLTVYIDDISTAQSVWVVPHIAGVISKVYVTLFSSINTANSVVTLEINGVLVTMPTLTITHAGSVAGSTYNSTPSGTNTVASGTPIEIITDGASSGVAKALVTIVMNTA